MIYLNEPNFLPIIRLPQLDHNLNFLGTDSEHEFKKNLKSQPSNWHYRTKEVTYNLNSNDYRTQKWDDIDWENSVGIFGCSNVLGVGLAEDETISSHLSNLLNCPVINLGVGASSMQHAFYNSLILKKHYPTPRAVVHVWTNFHRTTMFDQNSAISHLGSWDTKSKLFKEWAMYPANPSNHASMIAYSSSLIWKDITYYQASFFKDTSDLLACEFFPTFDTARDLVHPGKESAYNAAIQIYNNIK